jgi:hypothetical protein
LSIACELAGSPSVIFLDGKWHIDDLILHLLACTHRAFSGPALQNPQVDWIVVVQLL